jgi:hypothetical protein
MLKLQEGDTRDTKNEGYFQYGTFEFVHQGGEE